MSKIFFLNNFCKYEKFSLDSASSDCNNWFDSQCQHLSYTSTLIIFSILSVLQDVIQKLLKDPVIQECRLKHDNDDTDVLTESVASDKSVLSVSDTCVFDKATRH